MEYNITEQDGFKIYQFEFDGKNAIVCAPNNPIDGNPWLFKTEYFWAFPDFQNSMLKKGWHIAYVTNNTRWSCEADIERHAKFCDFLINEFKLNKKCVLVGMSCGGMQSVYFGARYPEYVKGIYVDAPVMNLLSCPFAVGRNNREFVEEFTNATGMTLKDLINYRNHPIDRVDDLIKNKIPVFLVCGDSDTVVPYDENGAVLAEKYRNSGVEFKEILKVGCDHHPHSLEDNTPIIEWAERL